MSMNASAQLRPRPPPGAFVAMGLGVTSGREAARVARTRASQRSASALGGPDGREFGSLLSPIPPTWLDVRCDLGSRFRRTSDRQLMSRFVGCRLWREPPRRQPIVRQVLERCASDLSLLRLRRLTYFSMTGSHRGESQLTVAEAVCFRGAFCVFCWCYSTALSVKITHTERPFRLLARWRRLLSTLLLEKRTGAGQFSSQALKVARGYLRSVVGAQVLTSSHRRREFSGRLGVATVLVSRFESIPIADAEEAIAALEMSIVQGNDPWTAVPYLLEAGVVIFDLHPDPAALVDLLARAKDSLGADDFVANPSAQLAAADAYLRLAGVATASARGQSWLLCGWLRGCSARSRC